jgi:hypothetical protein
MEGWVNRDSGNDFVSESLISKCSTNQCETHDDETKVETHDDGDEDTKVEDEKNHAVVVW